MDEPNRTWLFQLAARGIAQGADMEAQIDAALQVAGYRVEDNVVIECATGALAYGPRRHGMPQTEFVGNALIALVPAPRWSINRGWLASR
jgi:hypothetical protein